MRIDYPTGVVTAYYGRNATYNLIKYNASAINPHGLTTRDTYTCPAARRAVVTGIAAHINRGLASSADALAELIVDLKTGAITDWLIRCLIYSKTIYTANDITLSGLIWMSPGDYIRIQTADLAADGKCDYTSAISIVEFDP